MASGIMAAEKKRIIAAIDAGATQRATAKKFGRSISSIGTIIRRDRLQPTVVKHTPLTMEQRIERLVEKARRAARNGNQGPEVILSVKDFEQRVEETRSELKKLENRREQLELDLGTMLSNSCTEKEGDAQLAKINKLEIKIRKTRATVQSYLLRMGDRKRQDDIEDEETVKYIERYGVKGEEKLCDTIDRAIESLSKSCHELKRWKVLIDDQRYQTTGARTRPEHVGYSVSQRLIMADMNQFLHLGGKNHSFVKSSLFETLHPGLDSVSDSIPPLQTPESREAQLQALIKEKHEEVDQIRAQEEEQNQKVNQDEKPVSETTEPLPEGEELNQSCQKPKDEKN